MVDNVITWNKLIFFVILANPITVKLQYQISHLSNTKEDPGTFRNEIEITLDGIVDGKQNIQRQRLYEMLLKENNVEPIMLEYILPKFLKVTNRGTVTPVSVLMKPDPGMCVLKKLVRNAYYLITKTNISIRIKLKQVSTEILFLIICWLV